jgi:hypothetical protein
MILATAMRESFRNRTNVVGERLEGAIDIQRSYKRWVYKKNIDSRINDDRYIVILQYLNTHFTTVSSRDP